MPQKLKPIIFYKKIFFPNTYYSIVEELQQTVVPFHSHDFGEFVFILNGSGVHITESGEYLLQRGDVFVIEGDQFHKYTKLKNLHIFNILFDIKRFNILREEFKKLRGFNHLFGLESSLRKNNEFKSIFRLNDEQLEKIMPLLQLYKQECIFTLSCKNIALESYLKNIIIQICRNYSHSAPPEAEVNFKIEKAINYMKYNFAKKITLEILAKEAGMNISVFRRIFKFTTGYSPIRFLLQLRVAEAARLLVEENIKVKHVAARIGFNNQSYFVKTFKNIIGVTPKEYSRRT